MARFRKLATMKQMLMFADRLDSLSGGRFNHD